MITDRSIEAYLVVNNVGSSYYVYKQGDYPVTVQEVEMKIEADPEETDKYQYVKYRLTYVSDFESLGIYRKILNAKHIHYRRVNGKLESYYSTIKMERISSKTDLSTVEEEMGQLPPAMSMDMAIYDGVYEYSMTADYETLTQEEQAVMYGRDTFTYVYYIVDLDMANQKATIYYMLESDMQEREQTISFTYEKNGQGGVLNGLTLISDAANGNATVEYSSYSSEYNVYLYFPVKPTIEGMEISFRHLFTKTLRHNYNRALRMEDWMEYYLETHPEQDEEVTE